MSEILIFDTSVLIDDLRTGRHQAKIQSVTGLIRTSAVVLAELWRGATKASEREFLRTLARNHPILSPTENDWLDSGHVLGRIQAEQRLAIDKLRSLHFDVLIALTARSQGARLITSDREDFTLINRYRRFQLEVW